MRFPLLLLATACRLPSVAAEGGEPSAAAIIQGYSWLDTNGDFIFEEIEGRIPDVSVDLRNCDGDVRSATTVTDSNGWYSFADVDAGEYYVEFSNPHRARFEFVIGGESDVTGLRGEIGRSGCIKHPDESGTMINAGYRLKRMKPAQVSSPFDLPTPRAEAMARSIWGDASKDLTFDMLGEERTCGWAEDEPCVQHRTFLGGSAEAYDACDYAMVNAFGDPRLTRDVERYILFNSNANIPMSNCTSLLSASEVRGGAVASAREGFLERWPDGALSVSSPTPRPVPTSTPTPSSNGYFCAEGTNTPNLNTRLDFGSCDAPCPSMSAEECPGEAMVCARSEMCRLHLIPPEATDCEQRGALHSIIYNEDGDQHGLCTFTNGRACFLGQCQLSNPVFSAYCGRIGGEVTTIFLGSAKVADGTTASYDTCVGGDGEDCTEYSYYLNKCGDIASVQDPNNAAAGGQPTAAAIIMGYSRLDMNCNFISEEIEGGRASVLVTLRNCDGDIQLATTIADSNGRYSFPDVAAGEYYVEFSNPDRARYEFVIWGRSECIEHPDESGTMIDAGYCLKQMTSAPISSPFDLPTHRADAVARLIWGGASKNLTFDMFGEERTCGWAEEEPCVQHPTFLGGSAEAYDACDHAMANAFGDPRLTRDVERYILFNSDANIPMSNCTSLLSASEGRGGVVASAREGFLERWPDGALSDSSPAPRPAPTSTPTPPLNGYFCAERTYTQNWNERVDFGSCDAPCPSMSAEECPGENAICARSDYCDRLSLSNAAGGAPLNLHPPPDEHDNSDGAWSYLPVTLPTPLSDMSIALLAAEGDGSGHLSGSRKGVTRGYMVTGGCDSPNGNEYNDGMEYFECSSLSAKAYAFIPTRETPFQSWSGEFTTLVDMPRARHRHTSVAVNGKVCVFGGRDVNDLLINDVDCYDPLSNEWSTPAIIPEAYLSSDLAAFGTKDNLVHLVGGFDEVYNALDQVTIVDMSNFDEISFSAGPKLNTKRGDIDIAVANNGNVYVAGGYTHENKYSKPMSSVEKYNEAARTWDEVAPLNKGRGDSQLVAEKGKVYAIGGETKPELFDTDMLGESFQVLDSVELLEYAGDINDGRAKWTISSSMPQQLYRFAAFGWDTEEEEKSFIFALGGQTSYNSSCKCFPSTDRVIVFEENDENEESASGTPDNSTDIAVLPSPRPSAFPSRVMAGTAGPSGSAFGANGDGEEMSLGTLGNQAGNIASPGPSPSTQSMAGMADSPGSLPSVSPTLLASSAPSSLTKDDLVDKGDPPSMPSLMPSAYPSVMPGDVQSAMPTMDAELGLEPSRGGPMSATNYTSVLILSVALTLLF